MEAWHRPTIPNMMPVLLQKRLKVARPRLKLATRHKEYRFFWGVSSSGSIPAYLGRKHTVLIESLHFYHANSILRYREATQAIFGAVIGAHMAGAAIKIEKKTVSRLGGSTFTKQFCIRLFNHQRI